MKKYNSIFKLSFIIYIIFMIAMPYITGQIWADLIMLLFIASLIYQFTYLIALRKKDNKKFGEILILFIILGITTLSVRILIDYVDAFISGYTPKDIVGNSYGHTYYGMQAILEKKNELKNIIYIPYIVVNLIILIIYKLKVRKVGNRKNCFRK